MNSFKKICTKYMNMPVQVRASFWFLICGFLQKGISMLTTPIFTRLLSTSEYGQYNVFNSWLGIATIFVSLYLGAGAFAQGLVKYEEEKDKYASSLQGLTVILMLIWLGIYFLFWRFWNNLLHLSTKQILLMFSMIWTSAVFNFWSCEQRTRYKYKLLVVITIIVSLAKPIVGVILVSRADDKVTARIFGLAIVELIGYTWLFFVHIFKGRTIYSFKFWKHALFFNIPLVPHYLSQTVLNSSDRIMIERMIGESEAGIYSLAYSLSSIMIIFNTALTQTISPWMYQKIKEKNVKDVERIAYISLGCIAVVNIVLILFAPEIVAVFAPSEFYEAIWVVPPVAMSCYFMYSYDLFAKYAFYYERTKIIMLTSVVGAILNIVLNFVFISLCGYKAAGYTTLFCYIIYSVGHYLLMLLICKKYCGGIRPYKTKTILGITIPFLLIGFLCLLLYRNVVIRYVVILMTTIIVFVNRKKIILMIRELVAVKKH